MCACPFCYEYLIVIGTFSFFGWGWVCKEKEDGMEWEICMDRVRVIMVRGGGGSGKGD